MKFAKVAPLFTCLAGLLSSPAFAGTIASVENSPNGSLVSLTGTVENFDNAHSFTLRDASGTIKVDLSSAKPIVLKNGETVSVTGVVDVGLLKTDITAQSVSEDKGVGQQIGEAIDSVTGQDAAGAAQSATIQNLPESGLVKVDGTVAHVANQKKFTLKDSTGHVDVNIKSDELEASLKQGVEVTVVGYVGKGLLGKKNINATEVDLRSSNSTMAIKE